MHVARTVRPDPGGPRTGRGSSTREKQRVRRSRLTPPAPPPSYPHVGLAERYAAQVLDGTVPACKWVRLACERFQRDLARELDNDWPYRLDRRKAERICRFVELMPHTKGKWAKRKECIRLEAWQAFILVNSHGWVRRSDGNRRFRIVEIIVPRKNGKSALSAPVGLYMLCADGEYGAEVYCGATSEKQALEVFRPARDMARGRPDLIEHFGIGVHASNIHVETTASRFEPIIGKPGDGSSPHCSIVDEFHEHDTSELWDTMLTGMGARDQPMMWGITTAGTNLAGPCFDHVLSGRKLLEGLIDDEERFYLEYTIDDDDDWTSPEALRKANPNMGVSVLEDFLLARQRDAIRNPRDQAIFKTKHLNVWVNSRSAYFNMQSWAACYDPAFREADYHGRRAILGLDLASKNDIAALVALIPLEDGRIATFGRYYLPEDALENVHNRDLYYAWSVRDPAPITLTEGNIIDFERIEADIDELRRLFTIDEMIFDPSQATMLTTRLMTKGVRVTQFDQNARNFSEPMKQTAALMDGGKLIHGCDPQHPMSWMMSNVEARVDAKDQVYPRKAKPENKIDGPVAAIMAMSRTLSEVVQSVYETRGLLVL